MYVSDGKIATHKILSSALSSTSTGQYEINENIPPGKYYILVFTRLGYEKGYSGGGDNENSAEEVRLFYPPVKICATRILTAMRMLDYCYIECKGAVCGRTPLIPVNGLIGSYTAKASCSDNWGMLTSSYKVSASLKVITTSSTEHG
jgi:hypothetical protein